MNRMRMMWKMRRGRWHKKVSDMRGIFLSYNPCYLFAVWRQRRSRNSNKFG
jgi:hypothetical protein